MNRFKEEGMRVPVFNWADQVEETAMVQIRNLAKLPFAFHHIAIMPDCHSGYGMPIGGVLATQNVVIPNAVGVDIGCGMCAMKTSLKAEQLPPQKIKEIFGGTADGGIRSIVPVGFSHQNKAESESLLPPLKGEYYIINQEYQSARKQIGTLGGGNHFIEIQRDEEDWVWIMIHSGSRNLGLKVANHYNKIASDLNERYFSSVTKKQELAFLPVLSSEAQLYLSEMQYCVDFAFANRKLMMERIFDVLNEQCGIKQDGTLINIAHNYALLENHFGQNVWVHRKGATLARKGTVGIIPGSQGTASYIVEGLGNPDSFMSCSHGAGRKMSRTKAISNLSLEKEISRMDSQRIVHGIRNKCDLDESASAYKNIDEVMELQKDLVKIVHKLMPMGVIKG